MEGFITGQLLYVTGSTGKRYKAVLVGEKGKYARIRLWKESTQMFGSIQDAAWGKLDTESWEIPDVRR